MKSWKISAGAALCLFLLGLLIFLMQPAKEDLELIGEPSLKIDGGIVSVEGQIRNNIPQTYKDVTVTFELIDSKGEIVGEASTMLEKFYGDRIWEFSAFKFFALDSDVTEVELKSIEGTKTKDIAEDAQIESLDPGQKDLPLLEDDDLLTPDLKAQGA